MKTNQKQRILIGLVIALTATSLLYRIIDHFDHSQTGLMFIGIPAVLSIFLIFSSQSKSPYAQVFKGVTLFLLMVGILAWEGLICILMAAPIFYLVAFFVLWLCRFGRDRSKLNCFAALPVLLFAVEGLNFNFSFERDNQVKLIREVEFGEAAFAAKVSQVPNFTADLPIFFKLGFPTPLAASADGSFLGKTNRVDYLVTFSGPETYENNLLVQGKRVGENEFKFNFIEDSTKIGSWMTWQTANLAWFEEGGKNYLKFEIRFRRELDPFWYFKPIQMYAVKHAGNYLLDTWIDDESN